LQVGERNPPRGHLEKRRRPTGKEHEDKVALRHSFQQPERVPAGDEAPRIGQRMAAPMQVQASGGPLEAGDGNAHAARDPRAEHRFGRLDHRSGRLAGRDHEDALEGLPVYSDAAKPAAADVDCLAHGAARVGRFEPRAKNLERGGGMAARLGGRRGEADGRRGYFFDARQRS
jgi:hypothetical protein